jgi:hypothetical protein
LGGGRNAGPCSWASTGTPRPIKQPSEKIRNTAGSVILHEDIVELLLEKAATRKRENELFGPKKMGDPRIGYNGYFIEIAWPDAIATGENLFTFGIFS